MMSHTLKFDGTRFFLLVDGRNTVPLTIARQPSGDYWDKLLSMFEKAIRFDPTIELTIAFCIEYHETQFQTPLSNNRIFPTRVINIIPIPSNVRRFFKFLPVKILLDNFSRLYIEVRDTTLRLQGLEQLQKDLDAGVKETSSPLFREKKVMAKTEEMRCSLSKKYQDFFDKKECVFQQRQELSSLRNDQQSLLGFLERTKVELERSRDEFFASFVSLYPRIPNVLESADFPDCLKKIELASEPCDDVWKIFHQSEFSWNTQMPVLFGFIMTEMVKKSLSKSRLHKPMRLLSFDDLFRKLPKDMQKLYVTHRFWVINHSFLLILSSKLTNTCMGRRFSLKIQMRFLARLANKMLFRFRMEFFKLQRLSICI
jgi:hypothetical protein